MLLGSRERARQDAIWHSLRRRLPELDHADHRRYIEIECSRLVESLRAIRDEYRRYLEKKGCKPIGEMYWVVFKLGLVLYAVRLLREAAVDYIICTEVPFEQWEILYGNSFAPAISPDGQVMMADPNAKTPTPESLRQNIQGLVREETLHHVLVGGPFGRDGQLYLTRQNPGFHFWGPSVPFFQIVEKRQALWKKCFPWTKGLSQLFDSIQEELDYQYSLLATETKRVATERVKLSVFETVAYEHLHDMRRAAIGRNLPQAEWLKLFEVLDKSRVDLEATLTDMPKRVLQAVRRKGKQISTWEGCFHIKGRVELQDGRTYSLRREVMHAVHNAAKKAEYKLGTVF
jgi:hypothetical protein